MLIFPKSRFYKIWWISKIPELFLTVGVYEIFRKIPDFFKIEVFSIWILRNISQSPDIGNHSDVLEISGICNIFLKIKILNISSWVSISRVCIWHSTSSKIFNYFFIVHTQWTLKIPNVSQPVCIGVLWVSCKLFTMHVKIKKWVLWQQSTALTFKIRCYFTIVQTHSAVKIPRLHNL